MSFFGYINLYSLLNGFERVLNQFELFLIHLNVVSETASAVGQSQVSGVFTEALDLRVCEGVTICEDLETVLIHHRSPSVSKRIRNSYLIIKQTKVKLTK